MVGQAGGVRARLSRPVPARVALAVLAVPALASCGGLPPRVGPTGVDGLVVPTASPDPTSYVDGVDHPHLPLVPGDRWELAAAGGGASLVLEVEDGRKVAGVATTALVARPAVPAADVGGSTAWLAEDVDGNVWLLAGEGPDGAWEAGAGGARAGLALAADPRTGDGHPLWAVDGDPAAGATVLGTDGDLAVPWGLVEDVVTLALDTDPARVGGELRVSLAEGVGPVAVEDVATGEELVLVARS